jgi:hypothetical protein
MPNHYEDAIDTQESARAGALLPMYGFDARSLGATHLLYKVRTATKVTRLDTNEYLACCRAQACGWGYVQSLVFGEGEYAAGAQASRSAEGNYTVLSGGVARSFKVSSRKAIKGYIAAVIAAKPCKLARLAWYGPKSSACRGRSRSRWSGCVAMVSPKPRTLFGRTIRACSSCFGSSKCKPATGRPSTGAPKLPRLPR